MVKTPKCLASFSSGKMANNSLTALWPHAEKLHDAGCRLWKSIRSVLFLFLFFFTCLVWVSGVLRSPGCQRADPNMLGGNLLENPTKCWPDHPLRPLNLTVCAHQPLTAWACTSLNYVSFNAWWAARWAPLVGWVVILLNSRHDMKGGGVLFLSPSTVCRTTKLRESWVTPEVAALLCCLLYTYKINSVASLLGTSG